MACVFFVLVFRLGFSVGEFAGVLRAGVVQNGLILVLIILVLYVHQEQANAAARREQLEGNRMKYFTFSVIMK